MSTAAVLAEPFAGLQAQGTGLAEAAGLAARVVPLVKRGPWRFVSPRAWPWPLRAVELPALDDDVLISTGGAGARVGAALRRTGRPVVQVQHPRMDPSRFDVVVVNRHDGLSGPNVVVTRTALHPATAGRMAAGAAAWEARLAHLRRPLVAVLVGGSNGRFRFGAAEAGALGAQLAEMVRRDGVGVALTPSRRTGEEARAALTAALAPVGGWVWDMRGENPYFGLLGLADAFVVTEDSVSMLSEAVATPAPVLLAGLPGRSRRIRLFSTMLVEEGRVRPFAGRLESWPVRPIDDTAMAGAEVRRRLGL